jgi:hypothetical protein
MPTLLELRDALNAKLVQFWPLVTGNQYQYYQNHNHYWQGLKTHVFNLPTFTDISGDANNPDNLDSTPNDQASTWLDQFPVLNNVPITGALVMDTYQGPQGDGYVLSMYVKHNNKVYTRSQNMGPEDWRTQNWHIEKSGLY